MGLESGSKPEAKSDRLSYKDAIAKAEQLFHEGGDVSNALTIFAEKGTVAPADARQKAYQWRENYLNFANNERPSTNPDRFLKEMVSYQDAEKMTDWLETTDKNILIHFFNLQKSLDNKGGK